jgi:hypothetical protein
MQYGAYKYLTKRNEAWREVKDLIRQEFGDSLRVIYKEIDPEEGAVIQADLNLEFLPAASLGWKVTIP